MTRAEMYQTVREGITHSRYCRWETECGCGAVKSLAALAALEAEEREAPPSAPPAAEAIVTAFARDFFARHDHTYSGIEIYEWLKKQASGPVAPPAAECAARKAWERLHKYRGVNWRDDDGKERTGFAYGGDPDMASVSLRIDYDPAEYTEDLDKWLQEQCRAALAAPCECQRLREKLAKWKKDWREESAARLATEDQLSDARRELAELSAAKSEIARLTAERDHPRGRPYNGTT